MSNGRAKRWCFTINNFRPSEVLTLRELGRSSEICSFLVFGRESGAQGTRHLQGYIIFINRKRLGQVRALVSARGHFEVARGTPIEAATYCRKDGDFEEFGELPIEERGRRTDLDSIKHFIDEGASDEQIADNYFSKWVIHRRAFSEYRHLKAAKRTSPPEVIVYFGATGTGKTRSAFDESFESCWMAVDNQLNWFDGYKGEKAAIFDDFVGCKNSKFGFLLRLLDRYPMNVPIKGGFTNWIPETIYFTSNLHPNEWFLGVTDAQKAALFRRFTEVKMFHENGTIETINL